MWRWHHNHSCYLTSHPSRWTFNTTTHQNWEQSFGSSVAGSEYDLWCSGMCQGDSGELCSFARPHASHPLLFWRWRFLHLFLLPAKFKAHLRILQSKMPVTPINIATTHTRVQWRVMVHLQMHTRAHRQMHAHRYRNPHASMCHPYVHTTCPLLTSDPDISPCKLIHLASALKYATICFQFSLCVKEFIHPCSPQPTVYLCIQRNIEEDMCKQTGGVRRVTCNLCIWHVYFMRCYYLHYFS